MNQCHISVAEHIELRKGIKMRPCDRVLESNKHTGWRTKAVPSVVTKVDTDNAVCNICDAKCKADHGKTIKHKIQSAVYLTACLQNLRRRR